MQQGGAVSTCRKGAVGFAALKASHTHLGPRAVSLWKLPVFQNFPVLSQILRTFTHPLGDSTSYPALHMSLRELSADCFPVQLCRLDR